MLTNLSTILFKFLMNSPCHIYFVDINGKTIDCNEQLAKFLGFNSINEVIGKSHHDLYKKNDANEFDRLLQKITETGKAINAIESVQLSNNTYYFQSYKEPLKDEKNNIIGLIGISFNITKEIKKINTLENIIKQLPGHVWWTDLNGDLLGSNQQMFKTLGFNSDDENIGVSAYDLLKNNHSTPSRKMQADALENNDKVVIKTGETIKFEEDIILNDIHRTFLSTKSPLSDLDNNIIGVIGISQEITDNKNELKTLKYILSLLPGHVWWTDKKGRVLGCNTLMAKRLGFGEASDLIGKGTIDLISDKLTPEEKKKAADTTDTIDQKLMLTGQSFEGEEQGEVLGTMRTFYSQKIPLRDLDGNITGLVGIAQDITELKETQERLKQANEVKSEFIANMSHDIRTPITGLLGEAEYVEEEGHTPEMRECGRFMKLAAQQLLRLSNDVIEYVSLESGFFDEPIVVFNPAEVVHDVMTLMRVALRDKALGFSEEIDNDIPKAVRGCGRYFERIVSNLVANAIKFTEHGYVNTSLRILSQKSDEVTLQLIVEDTGIGIPGNKFNDIFEQFSKLNSSYQGSYKGNGLGLYAVKRYIEQMQGQIEIESVVGQGTKFIVNLPFDKAEAAQTIHLPIDRDIERPVVLSTEPCEVMTLDVSVNKKAKILVVEDSPLPARAVMRLLNEHPCEVTLVDSGEEAVKAALKKHYDLIIMDIGLPGIDGVEATRQIRKLPENSDTPIVALTGHIRGEKKPACIEAGMQEVFSKPLSRHQLNDMFKTYIDKEEAPKITKGFPDIDKYVFDITATLASYNLEQPKKLLDILEASETFIPEKLAELHRAVEADNVMMAKGVVQDLRGAMSYLSAPETNDLLSGWDNTLMHESPHQSSLRVMYKTLNRTLTKLHAVIKEVLPLIRKL